MWITFLCFHVSLMHLVCITSFTCFILPFQEMSAAVIEGNDAVTGHIISTTIGGKNGEPKQVKI